MEKVGTQPGIQVSMYHHYLNIYTGPDTTHKSTTSSHGVAAKAKEEEESIR